MLSVQLLEVLATAPRNQSEWVGPGLLGFVVLVSLGVATFLLWRNMNKQLRKVRFEEQPRPGPEGQAASGSSSQAAGSAGSGSAGSAGPGSAGPGPADAGPEGSGPGSSRRPD